MDRSRVMRSQYVDEDPDFGGMSAGAQNGGIVDAGAADDETDYADQLTGNKGGMVGDDDSVESGDFTEEEESAGIGYTYDADDI